MFERTSYFYDEQIARCLSPTESHAAPDSPNLEINPSARFSISTQLRHLNGLRSRQKSGSVSSLGVRKYVSLTVAL